MLVVVIVDPPTAILELIEIYVVEPSSICGGLHFCHSNYFVAAHYVASAVARIHRGDTYPDPITVQDPHFTYGLCPPNSNSDMQKEMETAIEETFHTAHQSAHSTPGACYVNSTHCMDIR